MVQRTECCTPHRVSPLYHQGFDWHFTSSNCMIRRSVSVIPNRRLISSSQCEDNHFVTSSRDIAFTTWVGQGLSNRQPDLSIAGNPWLYSMTGKAQARSNPRPQIERDCSCSTCI